LILFFFSGDEEEFYCDWLMDLIVC